MFADKVNQGLKESDKKLLFYFDSDLMLLHPYFSFENVKVSFIRKNFNCSLNPIYLLCN